MKKILVFVSLVILITSCASCNKVDEQTMNTGSKKKVSEQSDRQKLSPGTVSIKATVLENNTKNNTVYMQVDKVLGYGHSTPELAKGEKIYMQVKNEALKKQISNNDSLKIILKSSMQKVNENLSNTWKLINMK